MNNKCLSIFLMFAALVIAGCGEKGGSSGKSVSLEQFEEALLTIPQYDSYVSASIDYYSKMDNQRRKESYAESIDNLAEVTLRVPFALSNFTYDATTKKYKSIENEVVFDTVFENVEVTFENKLMTRIYFEMSEGQEVTTYEATYYNHGKVSITIPEATYYSIFVDYEYQGTTNSDIELYSVNFA